MDIDSHNDLLATYVAYVGKLSALRTCRKQTDFLAVSWIMLTFASYLIIILQTESYEAFPETIRPHVLRAALGSLRQRRP